MVVTCTIGKDGRKYYFRDGVRITEEEGKKYKVDCIPADSRKKKAKSPKKKKSPAKKAKSPKKKKSPAKKAKSPKKKKSPSKKAKSPKKKKSPVKKAKSPKKKKSPSKKAKKKKGRRKKSDRDCIDRSDLPLQPHQDDVVKAFEDTNSLMLVHAVGRGKTLSAVTISQCYLDDNPNNQVIVITPATLIDNFKKEIRKYGAEVSDDYFFFSFEKMLSEYKRGKGIDCRKSLLIIDEAHNLRSGVKSPRDINRYEVILKCAEKADKVLLLTATPFVNRLDDFGPLINLLYQERIFGTAHEVKNYEAIESKVTWKNVEEYLKGKVSYVPSEESLHFPKINIHEVKVKMTKEFLTKYKRAISEAHLEFSNPARFYNGYRRAVNQVGKGYLSEKLKKVIQMIREKKRKCFIYTNWIQYGTSLMEKLLDKYKIKYEVISGHTARGERQKIVNRFNEGEFKTLLITKAAGEGIDLKGVRDIYILDPTWNWASLEQIIGRGVRFKSHEHLPKADRKVDVWELVLYHPNEPRSGDELLYGIINEKKEIGEKINKLMAEVSIS